jgi:2-keto-4-pentenoate hydratase/2-oxohepta-3-ene-1,7-dioic acid hydratase in catechol pathway
VRFAGVEHLATLHPRPTLLPDDFPIATLLARVDRPGIGPCVVAVRGGRAIDVTSARTPTVSSLCELDDPADYLRNAAGIDLGSIEAIADNSWEGARNQGLPRLLAPVDLQAIKAAGVTFAVSLLERVIEEQARGDASTAAALRSHIESALAGGLQGLQPGSQAAMDLKRMLIERGLWSQYLEVGIGPDPEVFTKAQPMAAVGFGAHVGIPPFSQWNNPEPEVVLVANSRGRIVGAALGNDVNLRDVEGRSALLLGMAKDNNASAAIGPFVRLFDASFSMRDVRAMTVALRVRGEDGFSLRGESSLARISRDPEDLVRATIGERHQYPDGLCLYLGTMFAPTEDRFGDGNGFSHRERDRVEISSPRLGTLANEVRATGDCAPWTFGATALMRNLASRGLLS